VTIQQSILPRIHIETTYINNNLDIFPNAVEP